MLRDTLYLGAGAFTCVLLVDTCTISAGRRDKPRPPQVLCGGPDWPTSVLTGILRLDVKQMILGSTPFLLLNTPTVMAGAFVLN